MPIPRALLIILLLGGWIAAACIGKTAKHPSKYESIKIAYLVISITAFCVSILLLVLTLTRIVIHAIFAALDFVFFLGMIGVSIAAACAEELLCEEDPRIYDDINKGAFAVAGGFGCLAVIVYAFLIVAGVIDALSPPEIVDIEQQTDQSYYPYQYDDQKSDSYPIDY